MNPGQHEPTSEYLDSEDYHRMELELGSLICDSNPYVQKARDFAADNPARDKQLRESGRRSPSESIMKPDLEGVQEVYEVGDNRYRVATWLRIPYTYINEQGRTRREHLLVGFEGVGGGP